jgi:hypothetical protein
MKLLTAPQNEAILSNVGEIGEFRIRNSAKAFNILSSGLYANKIRAIIRELSCNATDSHVASGNTGTPFDLHLPNQLEPWFSIRDYGTGLSHEQVTNIYTTYFESTKTASNEFIGALGLGSKSPFSYTDNFTVTAIKDGVKGIYSAFINDQGVPSIALMMTEETDAPTGVEVKFSVNDRYDFDKFRQEACYVFTYFKLRPVVTGNSDFKFREIEYDVENIIPGVHSYKSGSPHGSRSVAVMGNIAYPIDIPNADSTLGDLKQLLSCGLELHFDIGDLDFQASREGLSYIPQTINSIKAKLELVNGALTKVLAKEADAITNLWDRAVFLYSRHSSYLWQSAVVKYVTDTKLATYEAPSNNRYHRTATFKLGVEDLAKKFNIQLSGFDFTKNIKGCPNIKSDNDYQERRADGSYKIWNNWGIHVDENVYFAVNDTKVGATERAKYHFRSANTFNRARVYVISKANSSKEMKLDAFFKALHNPPEQRILVVSTMLKKPRVDSGLGKNVTILKLDERGYGGCYRSREMVWKDAGKADSFDDKQTYYYLPLKGFEVLSKVPGFNAKQFYDDLRECGISSLKREIYGVRKSDIEFIKTQKNWINAEEAVAKELSKPIDKKIIMSLVLNAIDGYNNIRYNSGVADIIKDVNSPYSVFVNKLKDFEKVRYNEVSLKRLCNTYAKNVNYSPEVQVQAYVAECKAVSERYPLLAYLRTTPNVELAKYINLIDSQEAIKNESV